MQAAEAGVIRRPHTYALGRTCTIPGCGARLSRYNASDHCYLHTEAHFPRVRGEFTESWTARHG